ncbi:hypothetical protein Z043_103872 [Scleropages formosus]|uniref:F5/8 type C domain-containing protein n=1 Tax=Scleropages formosus TaxID=113540 RepID=A0A0P7XNA3_SCLFO|nr:hypothetical protein Z043_103872 [Scleropages formosus]
MTRLTLRLPHDNCEGPLGAAVPPSAFESSTQLSESHAPRLARLNRREGSGGWAPQRTDRNRWLQVDLRDRVEVTGVATQGRHGSSDWVTSYQLMVSDTGRAWKRYRLEDGVTVSPGGGADVALRLLLCCPIKDS